MSLGETADRCPRCGAPAGAGRPRGVAPQSGGSARTGEFSGAFVPQGGENARTGEFSGAFAPRNGGSARTGEFPGAFAPQGGGTPRTGEFPGTFAPQGGGSAWTGEFSGAFAPQGGGNARTGEFSGAFAPQGGGSDRTGEFSGAFVPRTEETPGRGRSPAGRCTFALVLGVSGCFLIYAALVLHLMGLFGWGVTVLTKTTLGWWIATVLWAVIPTVYVVWTAATGARRTGIGADCVWLGIFSAWLAWMGQSLWYFGPDGLGSPPVIVYLVLSGTFLAAAASAGAVLWKKEE